MRYCIKEWILLVLIAPSFSYTFAQTPAIDPALLAKANAGDAAAQQVLVGDSYAAGNGQARSSSQLAEDLQESRRVGIARTADKNDIAGELRLAALYRDGRGVPRDMAQAADWYRKAAEQGTRQRRPLSACSTPWARACRTTMWKPTTGWTLPRPSKGPNQEKYAAQPADGRRPHHRRRAGRGTGARRQVAGCPSALAPRLSVFFFLSLEPCDSSLLTRRAGVDSLLSVLRASC